MPSGAAKEKDSSYVPSSDEEQDDDDDNKTQAKPVKHRGKKIHKRLPSVETLRMMVELQNVYDTRKKDGIFDENLVRPKRGQKDKALNARSKEKRNELPGTRSNAAARHGLDSLKQMNPWGGLISRRPEYTRPRIRRPESPDQALEEALSLSSSTALLPIASSILEPSEQISSCPATQEVAQTTHTMAINTAPAIAPSLVGHFMSGNTQRIEQPFEKQFPGSEQADTVAQTPSSLMFVLQPDPARESTSIEQNDSRDNQSSVKGSMAKTGSDETTGMAMQNVDVSTTRRSVSPEDFDVRIIPHTFTVPPYVPGQKRFASSKGKKTKKKVKKPVGSGNPSEKISASSITPKLLTDNAGIAKSKKPKKKVKKPIGSGNPSEKISASSITPQLLTDNAGIARSKKSAIATKVYEQRLGGVDISMMDSSFGAPSAPIAVDPRQSTNNEEESLFVQDDEPQPYEPVISPLPTMDCLMPEFATASIQQTQWSSQSPSNHKITTQTDIQATAVCSRPFEEMSEDGT